MQETLNLDQTPPLHKTGVSGSTSDKDWTGNKNSIFKTLGASSHTEKEREENYFVASDNSVYNLKTKKKLQMQLKGYTKGFYLSGNFYSLIQLRKLLMKIEKTDCPF